MGFYLKTAYFTWALGAITGTQTPETVLGHVIMWIGAGLGFIDYKEFLEDRREGGNQ